MFPDELFALISTRFPEAVMDATSGAAIIPKERLLEFARCLKQGPPAFDELHCVTAAEGKDGLELVYMLYAGSPSRALTVKVRLGSEVQEVESLAPLWRSADWLEREVYDLFGVLFLNHPDLRRILNPDDWQGHPLRKNYSHPNLVTKPKF